MNLKAIAGGLGLLTLGGAGTAAVINGAKRRGAAAVITASDAGPQSLIDELNDHIVQPMCLLESSLQHYDGIDDVVSSSLNTFIAMYIAVASKMLNTEIDHLKVNRVLGSLNTDRDLSKVIKGHAVKGATRSMGLESAVSLKMLNDVIFNIGVESGPYIQDEYLKTVDYAAILEAWDENAEETSVGLEADKPKHTITTMGDAKSFDEVTTVDRLAFVRSVMLKVGGEKSVDGEKTTATKAEIPVFFKLDSRIASSAILKDIAKANIADYNLKTRVKLYQMGEITFKELLFGSDIIKAQNRARQADTTGYLDKIFTRRVNDVGYSAVTGDVPINRASGIFIITERTLTTIESEIGGSFDSARTRAKFFDNTATQTIIVVDTEDEMVTTYYRGIARETVTPLRWFKSNSKKNSDGADLLPVMRSILEGNVPRY